MKGIHLRPLLGIPESFLPRCHQNKNPTRYVPPHIILTICWLECKYGLQYMYFNHAQCEREKPAQKDNRLCSLNGDSRIKDGNEHHANKYKMYNEIPRFLVAEGLSDAGGLMRSGALSKIAWRTLSWNPSNPIPPPPPPPPRPWPTSCRSITIRQLKSGLMEETEAEEGVLNC